MDQVFAALKDYTAIVVACLAAAVSVVNLFWTTRLTEGRERRKILWEREFTRFAELEDVTGRLVEDLLRFNIRTEEERANAREKMQFLSNAAGRFRRYEQVAEALRLLEQAASWYISQDMKHGTKAEYEEARRDLNVGFEVLLKACDATLRNAPKGL